jgi:hypothetical protein
MVENEVIPIKSEELLERDLGDEIVVMSKDGKVLHTFEGSARFIWGIIDGVRTIDAMLECVTEEYQVATPVARSDLASFLSELRKLSLIGNK